MWQDGEEITQAGQDDERTDQVIECRLRSQSNSTKGRAEYGAEDRRFYRAGQCLVDTTESIGEWDRIVATKRPPDTAHGQERANNADHD